MAVKPKRKLQERKAVEPWIIHFLIHAEMPKEDDPKINKVIAFKLRYDEKYQQHFWDEVKVEVLKNFINTNPCQRPWAWWIFSAPKEPVPGWDYEHFNSAQRKRLSGIGTAAHEVLNLWGGFYKGIPMSWVDQWQADYYNGQAKDIHGNPIGTEYKEGDFLGVPIDPQNPPCFESETAYLQRLGLLTDMEKKYLTSHPELMKSEKIEFDENENE